MNFETVKEITKCPACGSTRIIKPAGMDYEACADCRKAWERLPSGEPLLRDGELMPFRKPCDNCAFRGDSPERADPEKWKALQESMAYGGGQFFCHKGVPFDLGTEGGQRDFEYPTTTLKSIQAFGHTLPAGQGYDIDKMRLCRGYLNAHVIPEMKRAR